MDGAYFYFNKRDRVTSIANKLGVSKAMVDRIIQEYHLSLKEELLNGQSVNISNLVTLRPVQTEDTGGNTVYRVRARASTSINKEISQINNYEIK
ncbi:MAG: hypothetical protein GX971_02725 [Firmicutes bacterium]|jgi:nucleoid DNA-binding protein|nr:hypothetical protein [Bacillota bacterium]